MSLNITDLDRLRIRFVAVRDMGRVPEEAWPIVARFYELSGYEWADAIIRAWRDG